MDKQTHIIFIMGLFIFILFIGGDWMKDTLVYMDSNSLDSIDIYGDIMKGSPKVIEGLAPNSVHPASGDPASDDPAPMASGDPASGDIAYDLDLLANWRKEQDQNYAGLSDRFEQTTNSTKYMNMIKGY